MPVWGAAQEILNWLRILRAHSHPLRCQHLSASGNTSQIGALARSGGGIPPGENVCVGKRVSGCKQTDHTSFHRGILICKLALCYFYIWMMSLHLGDIEMFCFVAQASTMAKASWDISAIPVLTEQHGLIKFVISIDEEYTRNHLFAGTSDAGCVCHFLWWERLLLW